MVEAAIAENDRFALERLELERDGPSYTVDTLEALAGRRGPAGRQPELTLILSADSYLDLAAWREPRRILELARLAVAPRDGYPVADAGFMAALFPDKVDRVVFLDGPRMRLSASELRDRARTGRSLRYLVPDAVAAYIDDHGLYRNSRRTVET